VVLPEPHLPLPLHAGLRRRQKRAGGVADQGETAARVALAVARRVEPAQGLDGLVERAIAALGVGVAATVVRQRAHHLDAALAEPCGQVREAGQEKDGQVASVDDVLAPGHALLDQVAKVGIQLRRASGDVDGVRGRPIQGAQTQFNSFAVHVLGGAIGTGVDVAVPAGHVAQPADVDLEDLEWRGAELAPAALAERGGELTGQREGVEDPALGGGWRER
jgi:hypothetical protein